MPIQTAFCAYGSDADDHYDLSSVTPHSNLKEFEGYGIAFTDSSIKYFYAQVSQYHKVDSTSI